LDDRKLDELLDDEKPDMATKKGRKKSTRKTILTSLAVVVVVSIGILVANAAITDNAGDNNFCCN